MGGKGREEREGETISKGRVGKGGVGRGGKCDGENRVQPQVPQVSAEECCEAGAVVPGGKERSVLNLGGKFLKDKSRNVHLTQSTNAAT